MARRHRSGPRSPIPAGMHRRLHSWPTQRASVGLLSCCVRSRCLSASSNRVRWIPPLARVGHPPAQYPQGSPASGLRVARQSTAVSSLHDIAVSHSRTAYRNEGAMMRPCTHKKTLWKIATCAIFTSRTVLIEVPGPMHADKNDAHHHHRETSPGRIAPR